MHRPIQARTRKNYLIQGLIGLFFGHRLASEKEEVKNAALAEAQAFHVHANRMTPYALESLHPAMRTRNDIMRKRAARGRGPAMRASRSKYNPVKEDLKHGLIDELPAHLA